MHHMQCGLEVVFHAVCQIGFCTQRQVIDICLIVEAFAQVGLVKTTVVTYAVDEAGVSGLNTYYWFVGGMYYAGEAEKSCQ